MAKAAKAKATTTRKKTIKKPAGAAKRVTTKKKSQAASSSNFFDFRVTEQTVYWLIFGAVSILFTLWIYTLDARVRDLYDQVDLNTYDSNPGLEIQAYESKEQTAEQ